MTISDNYQPDKDLGNGATTIFTGLWSPLSSDAMKVYLEAVSTGVQTLQTQGVDYTLSFTDSGYTVTMTTAPSSSYYVLRTRDTGKTQPNNFKTSKGWQGATVENTLDRIAAMVQEIGNTADRSLHYPLGDVSASELPPKATRASKYMAFDVDGEPVATAGTSSDIIVSTFMETVLDDTSGTDALTTLGGAAPEGTGAVVRKTTPTITAPTIDGTLFTDASATGAASVNIPHGTAPSSPVNGDLWTSTSGIFIRINSSTYELQKRELYVLGGELGVLGSGFCRSTKNARIFIPFKFRLTTAPTGITVANVASFAAQNASAFDQAASAITFVSATRDGIQVDVTVASGLVAGYGTCLNASNANGTITLTGGAI